MSLPHSKHNQAALTHELIEKGRAYYVPAYKPREMILDRGKGSVIWDIEGKDYIDLGAGIAVNSLGHQHPALIQALEPSAAPPSRLFLQQVSPHAAVVKWRGDAGSVCFATKLRDLSKRNWPRCADGVATAGGHYEATLTGLAPKQLYYYSVAGQIEASQQFRTPPQGNQTPKDGNTHIWIVGDSGTATETLTSYAGRIYFGNADFPYVQAR